MSDILCVGQMVVDILVRNVDEVDFRIDTKRVEQIMLRNGGDCLNTAIDLRQLGADVGFSGVLGKDMLGGFLYETLEKSGIDTSGIYFDEKSRTSSVVALINEKGERIFLYYGGSNDALTIDKVDPQVVRDARIVHVGGTYQLPGFDGKGAEIGRASCRERV